jgi:hypothetical protein
VTSLPGPATSSAGPAAPGGDIRIDRLRLRAGGLDENAARALARLVAEGLAAGEFLTMATADLGARSLGSLNVRVEAGPGDQADPDLLAQRIVSGIGRVLARDRVSGGADSEVVP